MLQRISIPLVSTTTLLLPSAASSSSLLSISSFSVVHVSFSAFSSSAAAGPGDKNPKDRKQQQHSPKKPQNQSSRPPSSQSSPSSSSAQRPSAASASKPAAAAAAAAPRAGTAAAAVSARSTGVTLPLKPPRLADIPASITDARKRLRWMVSHAMAYVNQPVTYTKGMTEEQVQQTRDRVKRVQAAVEKDLNEFNAAVDKAAANPKKAEDCKDKRELFVNLWGTIIKNGVKLPAITRGIKSFAPKHAPSVSEDARNLYSIAAKFGGDYTVQRVYYELGSFHAVLDAFPHVRYYLVHPAIELSKRRAALRQVITGRNLHPLSMNMIQKLFLENKFFGDPFKKLAEEVKELFAYNSKFVEVQVITAQKVKPHVLAVLFSAIQSTANPSEKYHFTHKLDKNVVGGFLIKIGDYVLDYTMKSDVRKYQIWLEETLSGSQKQANA